MAKGSFNTPMSTGRPSTPFVRSSARTGALGAAFLPLGIVAMILGVFVWRWRNDPSLQHMNSYAFMMNLMLAGVLGVFLGGVSALALPLAVRRIPTRTLMGWMLIALLIGLAFVVIVDVFPLGPIGACVTTAALLLHRAASARVPPALQLCPKCGYDIRGIDADPCPECGIGRFQAMELHDRQRFVSTLGTLGLTLLAGFWVMVTVWQWNSRFPLD